MKLKIGESFSEIYNEESLPVPTPSTNIWRQLMWKGSVIQKRKLYTIHIDYS